MKTMKRNLQRAGNGDAMIERNERTRQLGNSLFLVREAMAALDRARDALQYDVMRRAAIAKQRDELGAIARAMIQAPSGLRICAKCRKKWRL
jgi:hypothetical protein